jgi:hypothetical protein
LGKGTKLHLALQKAVRSSAYPFLCSLLSDLLFFCRYQIFSTFTTPRNLLLHDVTSQDSKEPPVFVEEQPDFMFTGLDDGKTYYVHTELAKAQEDILKV